MWIAKHRMMKLKEMVRDMPHLSSSLSSNSLLGGTSLSCQSHPEVRLKEQWVKAVQKARASSCLYGIVVVAFVKIHQRRTQN